MSSTKQLIVVSTWFQVFWFIGVLGQDSLAWLAVIIAVVTVLATHKKLQIPLSMIVVIAFIGIVTDSLNQKFGLLVFDLPLIPIWLAALWTMFAWYAVYLCRVINSYPMILVSIIGGVGGAMSYVAGFKLGAVDLGFPLLLSGSILFVEWFFIVLAILSLFRLLQKRKGRASHG